jgi:outer membrane protein OmpA-like peptidoglycan-associated protein
MRRIIIWSAPVVLAALALSGCLATRNWVSENLGKHQAQTDERFTRVDGQVREVGDATKTAQTRADAAQERADTAQKNAETAQSRADAAVGKADETNSRLSRLWTGRNKRTVVETVHVQFGFDRADLSDGAQTALLGIVKEMKTNADLSVDLEGYTDPTGPRGYNMALSQRRVESVRRYLIENGADLGRIYSIGMGPLTAPNAEHAKLRRVTVRLMVNPTD